MSDSRNLQETRAEQARRNKELITRYYDLALNKKDFAAARAYIGPYYRQHSTYGADGPEGLGAFVEWAKVNLPQLHVDVVGRRVLVQSKHVEPEIRSVLGFKRRVDGVQRAHQAAKVAVPRV